MATGSGTPQAQNSTVAGVSERQIDVTGALSAQASVVSGVSERKITQNADTYNRPLDNSPNIYYDDLDLVIVDDPAPFLEGTYLKTDAAFTVNGFGQLSSNSNYRVWEVDNGNSTYDIVIYNTSLSEWDVYPDQTASITTKSNGNYVSPNGGYDVSGIDQNQSYTEISPAFIRSTPTLSGVAERSMETSATLSSQQSSISALAEREVPAPTGAVLTLATILLIVFDVLGEYHLFVPVVTINAPV